MRAAQIVIGVDYSSGWWIAIGIAIAAVGAVTFIGAPLIDFRAGAR